MAILKLDASLAEIRAMLDTYGLTGEARLEYFADEVVNSCIIRLNKIYKLAQEAKDDGKREPIDPNLVLSYIFCREFFNGIYGSQAIAVLSHREMEYVAKTAVDKLDALGIKTSYHFVEASSPHYTICWDRDR